MHNHEPDTAAVEAEKVKENMRRQMRSSRARSGQVLAASVHEATEDVRASLGRQDSTKRNMRRLVKYHCKQMPELMYI